MVMLIAMKMTMTKKMVTCEWRIADLWYQLGLRWKPKALLRTRGKLAKRDDQPHDILDENHNDHDDETRMTFMIITGELAIAIFQIS